MRVDQQNYEHFMSVMAYGMEMVQYNPDCFGSSDIRLQMSGYAQMSAVIKTIIGAGYSPAMVVDPILNRVCTRCDERSVNKHMELKHTINGDFSIDVEVPYFVWFERWFNERDREEVFVTEGVME